MAIQSFLDDSLADFFFDGRVGKGCQWAAAHAVVARKLDLMQVARQLEDLRVPPGNRLELLRGDLAGLMSLRVNSRWRLVFRWTPDGPAEVRILDYH